MDNSVEKPFILIVDDEPVNSRLLEKLLKKDYATVSVDNGKEAIRVACLLPRPDIILLDIMMPEMDGYEVCRQLKADRRTNEIPIIFVSALDRAPSQVKGFELGAVEYIIKPYNPAVLKARIRSHVDLKRNRDHLQSVTLASINELDIARRRVFRPKKPELDFYIRFFLMAFFVIAISIWQYLSVVETAKIVIENSEMNLVEQQREIIEHTLHDVFSDLKIIAGSTHLYEMFDSSHLDVCATLNEEFRKFSLHKEVYDQVRFLDSTGTEKVRVNYNDGNPLITPDNQLQSKGNRYYFTDTMQLKNGAIFVSPFDLNIEHGEIERPYKPIIRFGTPIYDSFGRKKGIILLNYLGKNLLDKIEKAVTRNKRDVMLLNSDGYFLSCPDEDDEWGFMFKEKHQKTFENRYSDVWSIISSAGSGQFDNNNGLFTFANIYPWPEETASSTGSSEAFSSSSSIVRGQDYQWIIVSYVSKKTISSKADRLRTGILIVDFILITFLGAGLWLISSAGARRRAAEKSLKMSETRFSELFDRMGSGVIVSLPSRDNPELFITADLNRKTESLEKLKKENVIGHPMRTFFSDVFDAGLNDVLKRVWETGSAEFFPAEVFEETRLKRSLELFVYKLPSDEIVVIYEDVTVRKQAEEEAAFEYSLNESSAKISTLLLSADSIENVSTVLIEEAAALTKSKHGFTAYSEDGVYELIMSGFTIETKKACKRLSCNLDFRKEGRLLHQITESRKSIIINSSEECNHKGHFQDDHIPISRMIAAPAIQKGKLVGLVALANADKPYDERSLKIVEHLASLYALAIQQRKAMQRISYLAHHDPLTGLANRHLFSDRLVQAIVASRRHKTKTALLFLDLDNFKPINDSLGHKAGDCVLKVVADRLISIVRENDTVGRMGGDEFVIILQDLTGPDGAGTVAAKAINVISQPIAVDDTECFVGTSIGISIYPDDAEDSQTLQNRADAAMYQIKEKGKNGYAFYTED